VKEQDNVNILDALVHALNERKNHTNGNLPAKYDGDSPLPVAQPKGFLARLFDPHARLKERYEQDRLSLMLDTRFRAMEHEAKAYVDMIRIDQESKVRLHEHAVLQKEAVMRRYEESRAQILLHNLQQSLMMQVSDLGLDPTDEQYLIAKIVSICMRTKEEKPNGSK